MTLHYTGGAVMMADDVAEAVLHYARELAATQRSDVLIVPVVDAAGILTTAEFLIGPASQLLAIPVDGATERGRDQDVIDDIDRRTQSLRPPAAGTRRFVGPDLDQDLDLSAP